MKFLMSTVCLVLLVSVAFAQTPETVPNENCQDFIAVHIPPSDWVYKNAVVTNCVRQSQGTDGYVYTFTYYVYATLLDTWLGCNNVKLSATPSQGNKIID